MKRSVLLALLYLGAWAPSAVAGAVSVTGSLNETFDGSNNYFLSNLPFGNTYRSLSQINLHALNATPTTRYMLDTDFSYFKYLGPGAKEQNLTWGTPASERFSILHDTYFGKYNFSASWARSDVETTSLQQTGAAAGRGSVDNFDIDGGLQRSLTHLDTVSLSGHASTVAYSDSGSTPYVDFSSTASWRHRLTPLTNISQSLYFDWFFSDDVNNTQRLLWRPTTSIDSQLTKRLSFNASASLIFINAYQNASAPSLVSSVFQNLPAGNPAAPFPGSEQKVGSANGWQANGVLSYRLFQNTLVTLTATHATTPTLFGDLQQIESLAASLEHTINSLSSISFYAQFSRTKAGGLDEASSDEQSEFITASANYAYRLAREWRSNLTYTFRKRTDSTGSAKSNTILVALVHDFTLYGKPPESVVKTPSELAQESISRAQQAFPFLAPR